jgi:Mycothiol maleylpyruvate isomerase N-terminal domain
MRLADSAVVDVREPLSRQRARLLVLLDSLSSEQWAMATAAPEWSVKDIALHLIDVDLSWIARHRDREGAGLIRETAGHKEFVEQLAQRNQRWIDGTRVLSPKLVTAMLSWAGQQLDTCLSLVDLTQPSSVYWAGEAPVWFDLAREFTERWAHYRQICDAVRPGHPADSVDEFLPLVVSTFVWGYPRQYRADAPPGTEVTVEVSDVGAWTLTRSSSGWTLDEGQAATPAAGLRMTGEAAWRLLTGADYDRSQVRLLGDEGLAAPLLQVRGIIV